MIFLVNEFLRGGVDYVVRDANNKELIDLYSLNPRVPQTGIDAGAAVITVTLMPAINEDVYLFSDRIRSTTTGITNNKLSETYAPLKDPYFRRQKVLAKFTPGASFDITFNLNAEGSVGNLILFKASDILELSEARDVFVKYPLGRTMLPRVASDTKEDDSEIEAVLGDEPRLTLSLNLEIKGDYADDIPEDSDVFRLLEILSPQQELLFKGKNPWEIFIAGRSSRRDIRQIFTDYNRQGLQSLPLNIL